MAELTLEKNSARNAPEKDREAENPFNWEKSYQDFQNCCRDKSYIDGVLDGLKQHVRAWAKVGIYYGGYQPLLVDSSLPINRDWKEFPASIVPDLQELAIHHPELLLLITEEIKEATHSVREQISETSDNLYDKAGNFRPEMGHLLEELVSLEAMQHEEVVRRLWLHKLVADNKLTSEEADAFVTKVSVYLELMGEAVKEKVYLAHCLKQAKNILCYFAPSIQSLISQISDELIFVREHRVFKKWRSHTHWSGEDIALKMEKLSKQIRLTSVENREEDTPKDELEVAMENFQSIIRFGDGWMAGVTEGQPILFKPKRINTENKNHYVFHILVMAHELLHLVMAKQFGFDQQPIQKSENSQVPSLEDQLPKPKKYGFSRVLLEGLSIGLEHLVLKTMQSADGQDSDLIAGAVAFGDYRVLSNRYANRLWSERKRLERADLNTRYVPATYELQTMSYSEGTRLALALRRNGWSLDDIPDLVRQVTEKVIAITGIADVDEWEKKIVIERASGPNEQTSYEQVMHAVRQLKPTRLNNPV